MELVVSLSSPTTPLDAGIAMVVAQEAQRHFRALTPGGSQAVTLTDLADITSTTIADVAAEDGGTQTIDVTWTDLTDAAVIGYLVRVYDAGVFDVEGFASVGDEAITLTPVGGAGTYSVDVHAIVAAPVAGSATGVVVA